MTSIYNFTGFHSATSVNAEKIGQKGAITYNLFLLSGYVPLFALPLGVLHIYGGCTDKKVDSLSRVGLVARGILECIGLGLLFLIPDLIVSMHRHFCASRPPLTSTHRVND